MALTKIQKQKIIEDLKEKIGRQKTMLFINYSGVKVRELSQLRNKLKENNCLLKVAKKNLINLVLKEKNPSLGQRIKDLEGQLALVFGFKDFIIPAKLVYEFSQKNENLKILGGCFENEFQEAQDIITLAQLPGKEELLARLVRTIEAPVSNFVNVLEGNIKGLIYLLTKVKA